MAWFAASRIPASAALVAGLMGLACASMPAQAESATASLTLRVVVPPVTIVRLATPHLEFDLSAADIARGFATPLTPFQVEVLTNLRTGLQLQFSCISAPCELESAGASANGWQVPAGRGMQRHALSVPLRLPISRSAQPGRYRVGVQVTALGP
ncbi:MAG TPA: hypothetical protein VNB23_15970 [Ramlibacter sp.]|nr:hypothetical protein [Ramlibacter sp.]